MKFNSYPDLTGRHAFLSASKYHWIRYDEEKIVNTFRTAMAAQRGSELHELANSLIRLGQRLPKTAQTLNMFVNDALGFHMHSEQILYVSPNSFGTADAIWFGPNPINTKRNLLRVHDLKTGVNKSSVDQLLIYAAMFCIEYQHNPFDIDIELRIYQNDERLIFEGDPEDVHNIMEKLLAFDAVIERTKREAV